MLVFVPGSIYAPLSISSGFDRLFTHATIARHFQALGFGMFYTSCLKTEGNTQHQAEYGEK